MKTKFTLLATVIYLVSLSVKAQIPNSNFENWSNTSNYDSLDGWSSCNALNGNLPLKSLFQETPPPPPLPVPFPGPFQGLSAARIQTNGYGVLQGGLVGVIVNGQAAFSYPPTFGWVQVPIVTGGGTPMSYKPTSLNGFYIYQSSDVLEQGFAMVTLTRYNNSLQKRDTISYSSYNFTQNTNYTNFSIPLIDLMPGINPDTITTIFYSSNVYTPRDFANSKLYIDSIYLSPLNPSGIQNPISEQSEINIYPNPANGIFTIDLIKESDNKEQLEIIDAQGQKVKNVILNPLQKTAEVDMNAFADGIYFIRTNSTAKKIIIEKGR